MLCLIPYFGIGFVFLRLWLCEFRLKEELGSDRRYMSRILALYFGIAMIYDFQNIIFNLVALWGLVFQISAGVGWDLKFIWRFAQKDLEIRPENRFWMFLERITLHAPALFGTLYVTLTDIHGFVLGENVVLVHIYHGNPLIPLLCATCLVVGAFTIFDSRMARKPLGVYLLVIGLAIWGGIYALVFSFT